MDVEPGRDLSSGPVVVHGDSGSAGDSRPPWLDRWAHRVSRPGDVAVSFISMLAGIFVLPSSVPLGLLTTVFLSLLLGLLLRLYRRRQRRHLTGDGQGA